ncbi:MAG: acyltransferase family protein [Aureliella sp.]
MNSASSTVADTRRHDLDALRAIAMLLGILLHAAMSFIPFGWVVTDKYAFPEAKLILDSIHGFRMPLFFLLSGYFTCMLWEKRGVKGLLIHRAKRILLPLVVSMFTIIPAVWAATIYVTTAAVAEERTDPEAAFDETDSKNQKDESGSESELLDPEARPRSVIELAALRQDETLSAAIAAGADVDAIDDNGSTALHVACLFGYDDIAEILLEAGADPLIRNKDGSTAVDTLYASMDVTRFIAGLLQIEFDEERITEGRRKIGELMEKTGQDLGDGKDEVEQLIEGIIVGLFFFPVFHHLWFLWFLVWFVLLFALAATVVKALELRPLPSWLVASPIALLWLVPATAILQWFQSGFGPDTSIGLIPLPNVFAYYTLFFFFGAIYFSAKDQESRLTRGWWLHLILAPAIFFPAAAFFESESKVLETALRTISVACYTWSMTIGFMGAFERLLSKPSPAMRYVSDSSYWLYITHIPFIMMLQFWIRDWDQPAWIKILVLCGITTSTLLISYQLLVRHTFIGTMLNGARRAKIPASH